MNILSIETSCDETAVSIVKADGQFPDASYEVLGDALHSQVDLHAEYGGVFPMLAKREHAKKLIPMLTKALDQAELLEEDPSELSQAHIEILHELLVHEEETGMVDALITFFQTYQKPEVALIAVTSGPGLEPALWVGVNFAKALAEVWNIHVVPVNHMEGHVLASIFDVEEDDKLAQVSFPAVSLLISGGHTELLCMKNWSTYEKIGQTRDDAVGEAFDKVARMMGLPYPGGPEISRLAKLGRASNLPLFADLPRPMIHSKDLDFSFSGLKTAVRYAIDGKELGETDMQALARDFEDAATEVLIKKTQKALDETGAQTLIIGGGVSANDYIRNCFHAQLLESHRDVEIYFPNPGLSTDNSVMIALSGHARSASASNPAAARLIKANGNRSIDE